MKKKLLAATLVASSLSMGTAYAGWQVAISSTYGGAAKNSSQSDWSRHVYVCDTKDDGHEMEVQALIDGRRDTARDSLVTPGCGHLTMSDPIEKFRACRLMVFDECGGYVAPSRTWTN